jgi:hypothetical protein
LRKVNRCLTEGRKSFLERYAGIESGAECERWAPVISAMVDGEATPEQILELRPHLRNCPGCRATLKALHDSSAPLSAILPIPLAVTATDNSEHLSNLFMRAYEAIAGGVHERAVHSVTKAQAAIEAAAAGKVAAVAASAAAVAGGGYATVERSVHHPSLNRPAKAAQHQSARVVKPTPVSTSHTVAAAAALRVKRAAAAATAAAPKVDEFGQAHGTNTSAGTEFAAPRKRERIRVISAGAPARPPARATTPKAAPEFASSGGNDEFGG